MDKFLSCDWGTSAFRLRLVETAGLRILGEIKNDHGIAGTYRSWEQQSGDAADRMTYYRAIIQNEIELLSKQTGLSLEQVPVALSGMASSTIGLLNLPYKTLPFNTDGSDIEVKLLAATEVNPLLIISGARTAHDIMRGEETKVIGYAAYTAGEEQEQLFILPGTHPKHILVKGHQAVDFQTFMTGELFDLLSAQSILAVSVEKDGDFTDPANQESFVDGVKAAQTSALLHAAFRVRTNHVLKKIAPQQNYYYLSGLLIGTELKEIPRMPVYLSGSVLHLSLYTLACQSLGIRIIRQIDADEALIRGQQLILSKHFKPGF